jgi:hypothetical protein
MPFRCAERRKAPPPFWPAGRRKAPPVEWERLCHDVRPLVLGNLSLRELARAAVTCREFRDAYQACLTEERGRLRSVAEGTFGKKRLAGFVTVFHGLISGTSHEGLISRAESLLVIGESGHPNLLTYRAARGMPVGDGRIIQIRKWCNTLPVSAVLWGQLPGSCEVARVSIHVGEWRSGVSLVARVSGGAGPAAVGLMLCICTENPADVCIGNLGDMPATWESPFNETFLAFEGLEGVAGRRKARDLVGPLRPLARSFASRAGSLNYHSRCSAGEKPHPLGHLEVSCDKCPPYRSMVPRYM